MEKPGAQPTAGPSAGSTDVALLLVLGAMWGSAFPVIRIGLLAGAAPFAFGAARYAIAAAAVVLLAVAARETLPGRRDLVVQALLGGGPLIGGYAAFLYTGEVGLGGGLAAILIATSPLATAAFSLVLLPGDRLGWLGGVGIVLGFLGVVVISIPLGLGQIAGGLGDLLAVLAAGLIFSIGSVVLRRTIAAPTRSWALATQFAAGAAVLGLLAVAVPGEAALPLTPPVVASLAFLVILPSIVGYAIYFRLHHRAGPTRANVVSYVAPVAGLAVGVALGEETIAAAEIAGFALIVVGLYLLHRRPSGTPGAPK